MTADRISWPDNDSTTASTMSSTASVGIAEKDVPTAFLWYGKSATEEYRCVRDFASATGASFAALEPSEDLLAWLKTFYNEQNEQRYVNGVERKVRLITDWATMEKSVSVLNQYAGRLRSMIVWLDGKQEAGAKNAVKFVHKSIGKRVAVAMVEDLSSLHRMLKEQHVVDKNKFIIVL